MATYQAEVGEEASALTTYRDLSARNLPDLWDSNILGLVAAIEHSRTAVAELSVAALQDVLNGIITGEGPTAAGRVHFSRSLDPADAALCVRILEGAGGTSGLPVTRHEADVLFDIDAAAAERTDNGRFADLFVKSIAHCALAEAGHRVPPRQLALARATELSLWANRSTRVNGEVLAWMAAHVNNKRRSSSTLSGLSGFLAGVGARLSFASLAVVTAVDLA
jgi:hypothetical protein